MVSAQSQVPSSKPLCPVCHRSDKVKTLQAAYEQGNKRLAPPPMPTKQISMQSYVLTGMVIVALCVFMIIIFVGSESFGQGFSLLEIGLVSLTLLCIIVALGLSYYAFQKVLKADEAVELEYPAWDKATEQWNTLRYCSRDNVIFDPNTEKVVSDDVLAMPSEASAAH
ncbi:MAG: hypothetical protein M3Z24_16550 [Chloroflexota bacterium]|nr:hypothetical protein [Chloroflexota bacterium]